MWWFGVVRGLNCVNDIYYFRLAAPDRHGCSRLARMTTKVPWNITCSSRDQGFARNCRSTQTSIYRSTRWTDSLFCTALSNILCVDAVGEEKRVKQQYVLHMSPYGELRPTGGCDRYGSLRHPCKFQRVSHLRSVTARHLVVGVSQTLRR